MAYFSTAHGRTFGFGWRADTSDFRDWKAINGDVGAPRLLRPVTGSVAAALPSAIDFADAAVAVYDQGGTESCVPHAVCSAVEIYAKLRGIDLVEDGDALSRRAAYNWGRGGIPPFGDDGCFPRTAMGRYREWGFCGAARWAWSEAGINEPLPFDVIEAGGDARLLGYYRVDSTGEQRCAEVKALLAEGYPVPFGQACYEDLIHYVPQTVLPDTPQGAMVGRHMTTIVGYKEGKGFHVLNSWGLGWGEAGFYWMSEARFGSGLVDDIYALTCSPLAIRR